MKYVYGWGASVVIVGALFKILHWPGANIMLIVGLLTEAFIFFISVFEPSHEEVDWTLVYPELALGHADDDIHALPEMSSDETIVEQLDNMLADSKIEPELIESLGKGMRNLSDSANKLNDISSASDATEEYVSNLKGASSKVGELSNAYDQAANSIAEITASTGSDSGFGEQLEKVSGNLSALNNVYEMQLKGATDHLQVTEQMYSGINELMTNLHSSLDDTKRYKDTMSELSENLTSLNTVYGNMLSAMNVNRS
ncbi:MAG: gliding motility protein GldL [Flavobacteriales bacterium]|nr:gliding motility protein GldL [Flavobacteriales bacterium]